MSLPLTDAPSQGKFGAVMLLAIRWVGIAFTVFQLYTGLFSPFPSLIQRAIHVGFGLVMVYLLGVESTRRAVMKVILLFLAVVSIAGAANIVVNYETIIDDPFGRLTPFNVAMGIAIQITLFEAVRRQVGTIFACVFLLSILYALFGWLVPGDFGHRGFDVETVVDVSYLTTEGMWGIITGLSAAEIGMFIIFGSVLTAVGGGDMFIKIALALAGGFKGGAAQVAAVASSMFGMINGSSAANAATTGSLTIPMMKRLGYSPALAAAVEATASTGGQLMPPIMGIVAFLMAEIIGVPYLTIALAAVIPGLIYYLNIMAGIYFLAQSEGLKAVPREDRPTSKELLNYPALASLITPIALILYLLIGGRTPLFAGTWGTGSAIVLYLVFGGYRQPGFVARARDLLDGFAGAGKALAYLAVLSPAANVVVSMIGFTGVGVKFAQAVLSVGESSLFLALLLGGGVSLILGMGMPSAGAYLLAAAVVAPSLITLGVLPIAAHFFIFYFAIIAAVTPPVCATLFITCSMAGAKWERGAVYALRLAMGGFIVPFVIVYAPDILLGQGDWIDGLRVAASTAIGVVSLSAATFGYLMGPLRLWEMGLLAISGIAAVDPNPSTDILGLCVLILVLVLQRRRRALVQPESIAPAKQDDPS